MMPVKSTDCSKAIYLSGAAHYTGTNAKGSCNAPPRKLCLDVRIACGHRRIGRKLVELLTTRAGYIDRAIELKTQAGLPARIEHRVDQVLGNIRNRAEVKGLDPELTEALWTTIINWSITREETVLG
jgi:isochorismate pyruvate lyase